MSQEEVRQLLLELGGKATVSELSKLAQEKFPDRTLHTYLSERLQPMEKKGFVQAIDDGKIEWHLTEKGRESKINYPVSELDAVVDQDELAEEGFTLSNLVGSLRLDLELDLSTLSTDLSNTDYHPETYPSMIYRPFEDNSVSVLTPSSGRLAIVGAKSKQELIEGVDDFLSSLRGLGIDINRSSNDLLIQNIVASYDFERQFNLSTVALDLNRVEYDPEQFPGLTYRSHSGNTTVLMFTSGKVVVTGAKTYLNIIQAKEELYSQLEAIGVDFPE